MRLDIDAPAFLLGFPRSGTTWLSQIIESSPHSLVRLSPLYSFDYRNQLSIDSARDDWRRIFMGAAMTSDIFMTQNWQRQRGNLPYFPIKKRATRFVIKDTRFFRLYLAALQQFKQAKIVFIIRNPTQALMSWADGPEFASDDNFSEVWRTGGSRKNESAHEFWGFDDWLMLTREFLALEKAFPSKVRVLRYEDLVRRPASESRLVFDFLQIPFTSEVERFIKTSTTIEGDNFYSVFRNHQLIAKKNVPAEIEAQIEAVLVAEGLERFLN